MAFDLLIRNGILVDGSGMPRYRADVGIKQGQVAEIGRICSPADETIDAEGMIVAPGFIDGHTHMDAQVAWDPLGSCSCWHGRDQRGHGQLRVCAGALQAGGERGGSPSAWRPWKTSPRTPWWPGSTGAGETFPEYLGRRRIVPQGHQLCRLHRPLGPPDVRDGRPRPRSGGRRRRPQAHGRSRAGGARGRCHGPLFVEGHHAHPAGRRPGRKPDRQLGGDCAPRARHGRPQRRHLPGRARRLRRRGAARLPG